MVEDKQSYFTSWAILPISRQIVFFILSFLIVAFGQPAWLWWSGLLASIFGYALFWRVVLSISSPKIRFWLATSWFTLVQSIQLSWLLSHMFFYIYGVYFFFIFSMGLQFGLVSLLVTPKNLMKTRYLFIIPASWVLMEWARLFFMTGFSWNPSGLALTGNIYTLQLASLIGAFGLTYWVMLTNLLALRTWYEFRFSSVKAWFAGRKLLLSSLWLAAALFPYVFGSIHLNIHRGILSQQKSHENPPLSIALVQTYFPVTEDMEIDTPKEAIDDVFNKWSRILKLLKKQLENQLDLIVLPEYTVSFGTYYALFPYDQVVNIFKEIYGEQVIQKLPKKEKQLAMKVKDTWLVNNAFFGQAIANIFDADVIVGLQDDEFNDSSFKDSFSSAFHFVPFEPEKIERYDKRVLVPMGEYIPFESCKSICARYGIAGSFKPGKEAKVMKCKNQFSFGVAICYEETHGDLMRENKLKGAKLLVNLTSDAWYPSSRLPKQHFDHARLRTVEMGVPLVRACNTGITGAVDSLGQVVKILEDEEGETEKISDSLHVMLPTYTYTTLYSYVGDGLIIGLSLIIVLLALRFSKDEF